MGSPKRPPEWSQSGPAEKRRRLSTPSSDDLSDGALLYYNARAAHVASTCLLQAAFLPASARVVEEEGVDHIVDYTSGELIQYDPQASCKALALQVYALDCLRVGLRSGLLSIGERAPFTVEFATIAVKVLESQAGQKLDGIERIQRDAVVAINEMTSSELHPQMAAYRSHLEWLSVKLAFLTGRPSAAKRLIKQYASTARAFYALSFLQLQYSQPSDNLPLLSDMLDRARSDNDRRLTQLLALARVRLLFALRRWDAVPSALADLADLINWREESYSADGPTEGYSLTRHSYLLLHYMLLRSLWEGRLGNDTATKGLLQRVYLMIDEASDTDRFIKLKVHGGLLDVGSHGFYVQSTPANINFLLVFLATVTSRRDYIGYDPKCKSLVHARAMMEFAEMAKMDDMWDTGFHTVHGLAKVETLHREIYTIHAEMHLEQATTLMFRSAFEQADEALSKAIRLVQKHKLDFLKPQLCIVNGQLAQLLGVAKLATRYYEAALNLMVPGNELGMMAEASILGTSGAFQQIEGNHQLAMRINTLAEKCRKSSNAMLQVMAGIMLSLTDSNRHQAKRKISATYDLCQSANNNLLRGLVFAFTTSTLLTGHDERVAKQLETGLELSTLLGGKDREDRVGQTVLGLWFALRLRSHHNRQRNLAQLSIARSIAQRHQHRLGEIMEFAEKKYGVDNMDLLGEIRGAAQAHMTAK